MVELWDRFLSRLQDVLAELHGTESAKQQALASMDVEQIDQLTEKEHALAQTLAEVAGLRGQLLAANGLDPNSTSSLREIFAHLPDADRTRLLERLGAMRSDAKRVQDLTCSNWLATYRTFQHVYQLLEIIANAGKPTGETTVQGAGLMLDHRA